MGNRKQGVSGRRLHGQIEGFDSHGMERMKERGVTLEDAQEFINTAVIMFEQDGGMLLYLSTDGGAVMVDATGALFTAYPKGEFKKHIKEILKVVLSDESNNANSQGG